MRYKITISSKLSATICLRITPAINEEINPKLCIIQVFIVSYEDNNKK